MLFIHTISSKRMAGWLCYVLSQVRKRKADGLFVNGCALRIEIKQSMRILDAFKCVAFWDGCFVWS